eukprot:CAMPEP_0117459272 /NCGR_PEP_ID=MMETSP0784-20121206/1385_1 /TAXON_ID=39447 /ORGANISM="" /LENGTH=39 /DNA_ID= /DNA_START= /DNA_END= /DNA_ORIENTATION=
MPPSSCSMKKLHDTAWPEVENAVTAEDPQVHHDGEEQIR